MVGYGVLEAVAVTPGRLALGVTTTVFFLGYGAGLVLSAWGLRRLRSWARGPVLLAQLIQLGLAWSFRGEATVAVAVALAAGAVIVLVGVLNPASIKALADEPT